MLFLTEVNSKKRPASTVHHSPTYTRNLDGYKFIKQPPERLSSAKSKSVQNYNRRPKSTVELEKTIDAIKSRDKTQ